MYFERMRGFAGPLGDVFEECAVVGVPVEEASLDQRLQPRLEQLRLWQEPHLEDVHHLCVGCVAWRAGEQNVWGGGCDGGVEE